MASLARMDSACNSVVFTRKRSAREGRISTPPSLVLLFTQTGEAQFGPSVESRGCSTRMSGVFCEESHEAVPAAC